MGLIILTILSLIVVPISSVFPIRGTMVWFVQLLALQLVGGIALGSCFWKLNKFLAFFIFYLSFSYVIITETSLRSMLCLLTGYMAVAIILMASQIKKTKPVYIALVVMASINIVYSILQNFRIDPFFTPANSFLETGLVSFLGSHNQLGIYSATTAFFSTWLLPLSIIPMYLAKCNSALLGLIVGSFVYIYFIFGKKYLSIILLVFGIIGMPWFSHSRKSSEELMERVNLWKLTASQSLRGEIVQEMSEDITHNNFTSRILKDNSWLGFGIGKFFEYSPSSQFIAHVFDKKYYQQYSTKEMPTNQVGVPHVYEHAHNDILEAWFEFGHVGLFLVLGIIFSVIWTFCHSFKTHNLIMVFSSLVAQAVCSLSVYVFQCPTSLFMACLTIGLFYAEVEIAKTQSKLSTDS